MPQYYPHNPDQMGHHHQSGAMFGSILNSGQPHQQQSLRPGQQSRDPLALERAARLYRSAASVCEASCTWSGQLPPRSSTAGPNSSYSTKIFLGGVPWDISEQTLVQGDQDVIDLLSKYGQDKTSRDSFYYKICNTGGSRRMRAMRCESFPGHPV